MTLLDLERIEDDIFRGVSPLESSVRIFGGQVAGQALVAAGRTVPPDAGCIAARLFHPAGDPRVPIVYDVDRIRDGRSFTTRRVVAIQHGKAIFSLSASFQLPEQGLEHADPMPEVAPPEQLDDLEAWARRVGDAPYAITRMPRPFDLRYVTRRCGRVSEMKPEPGSITSCGCAPTAGCPTIPWCTCACWLSPRT